MNNYLKSKNTIFQNNYQTSVDIALGRATGNSLNGKTLIPISHIKLGRGIAAHELGHAFGLRHDLRIDAKRIFTNRRLRDWMTTSYCAAEWLDVNRYFNIRQNVFTDTNVQMHAPRSGSDPNSIYLKFEITDPDGLRQAQLYNPLNSVVYPSMIGCKKLNEKSEIVEFLTTDLTPKNIGVILRFIDVHGNFGSITSQLILQIDFYLRKL